MKFTKGYWLMQDYVEPIFATEARDASVADGTLTVNIAGRTIHSRGETLGGGWLRVDISSPMPEIIRVKAVHHDGEPVRTPDFVINETEGYRAQIDIGKECATVTSGALQACVSLGKGTWGIDFVGGGRALTQSGFRALAHITDKRDGARYMKDELSLSVGEYVYGLGERFTPFIKNGQVVDSWNEDGGTASEIAYKNIPFYITNKGYGVLVNDAGDASFEVGSEKVERVQFRTRGERLEYYVIYGETPRDILTNYAKLTGFPALPPAWSFGLWLTTSFTTSYDEDTVTSFIQGMEDRHIPLHVFHFDCFWMRENTWCDFIWDPDTFPNPEAMLKRLKERGLKICVWINPYIAQKSYMFEEGKRLGFLLKTPEGGVWQWDLWQSGMGIVDFTNPDAVKWYQDKLEALLDMGVDCFKTDFGERIPFENVVWHDGSDPMKMHNFYAYLYNKVVFELLERKRGRGEAMLFARSATVGAQKFPAHWGGDCSATYTSMAETLRGGLSLAMGGFGFWSHDISGFEHTAPPDVYKRWCAFGMLSSHSRLHGSQSYRVPWLFDDEACRVLDAFTRLKCRLMPYLYQKAVEAHTRAWPMMRPMTLEFPDDRGADTLDLQYMLGDALLVAPVFSAEGAADYYLPRGVWTDYFTGAVVEGGSWHSGRYDMFHLPLYVRENTILPIGSVDDRPDYDYTDGVTLELHGITDGAELAVVIPDLRGEKAMEATVTRSGGCILVKSTKRGLRVLTVGIFDKREAGGATVTATERGMLYETDKDVLLIK